MGAGLVKQKPTVASLGLEPEFTRFLSVIQGEKKSIWKKIGGSESLEVFSWKESGKDMTCVRGNMISNLSAEDTFAFLWKFKCRPMWDRFYNHGEVLDEFVDNQIARMSICTFLDKEKKLVTLTRKCLINPGSSLLVEIAESWNTTDAYEAMTGFWIQKLSLTSSVVVPAAIFELSRVAPSLGQAFPSADVLEKLVSGFSAAYTQINEALKEITYEPMIETERQLACNKEVDKKVQKAAAAEEERDQPAAAPSPQWQEAAAWESSVEERRRLSQAFLQNENDRDSSERIHWLKGRLIGTGAVGDVYLGLRLQTGELMAVKQVNLARDDAHSHMKRSLEKEVQILSTLRHPNIVEYYGIQFSDSVASIFLEYVSGGSIASMLSKNGVFTPSFTRNCTRQIVEGLSFLHSRSIAHRDIKGANIMCTSNGIIKLADFGAATIVADRSLSSNTDSDSIVGTPYAMAPEVIVNKNPGMPADIWALGCVVVEMVTGRLPWAHCTNALAAMFLIANSNGPPELPSSIPADIKEFICLCMQPNPDSRPRVNDLKSSSFLRQSSAQLESPTLSSSNSSIATTPIMQESPSNRPNIATQRPSLSSPLQKRVLIQSPVGSVPQQEQFFHQQQQPAEIKSPPFDDVPIDHTRVFHSSRLALGRFSLRNSVSPPLQQKSPLPSSKSALPSR